jgi:hypothetical protein
VDREPFQRWIEAYEAAWRADDPDLSALFAPDATYSTAPYRDPYRGLDAIAGLWRSERGGELSDYDGVFAMESEIVAVEGDTGVVRVYVSYGEPVKQEYRDLWVVTLDGDGRCTSFEEWPFWPEGTPGSSAGSDRC